ncbi:MAG: coenzyme F420-0:L-glutamate ligase [Thermoprotei archaeon]|nr:MAG: coenzyme F420-0:L-glutamate ligase [Thermoprotei archaeon]
MRKIEIIPLYYDKEILPGDDLGKIIVELAEKTGISIKNKDVVVVSHKVVSKAEGRVISLNAIKPSQRAIEISMKTGKDSKIVELILREASEVLKVGDGHIITLSRHGIVCANSGVDRSNSGGPNKVVLLPVDPDKSAEKIRVRIRDLTGKDVAVVISDTYGRPFRLGVINLAIGLSGIKPFRDYIGKPDRNGYIMRVTQVAIVDEIASAAELVMGQGSESTPFAIIRNVNYEACNECSCKELIMDKDKWLFK